MKEDTCEDCAHYDDGFDWEEMTVTTAPSCLFKKIIDDSSATCKKFYNITWLSDLEEDKKYSMEVWKFKQSGKYYDTFYFKTSKEYMYQISEEYDKYLADNPDEFVHVITGKLQGGTDHPNAFPLLRRK